MRQPEFVLASLLLVVATLIGSALPTVSYGPVPDEARSSIQPLPNSNVRALVAGGPAAIDTGTVLPTSPIPVSPELSENLLETGFIRFSLTPQQAGRHFVPTP